MVKEIKGEKLGTVILYFPVFLYFKMTRAGKGAELSPCERLLTCQLKLSRDKFLTIRKKFMKIFGKMGTWRSAIKAMSKR